MTSVLLQIVMGMETRREVAFGVQFWWHKACRRLSQLRKSRGGTGIIEMLRRAVMHSSIVVKFMVRKYYGNTEWNWTFFVLTLACLFHLHFAFKISYPCSLLCFFFPFIILSVVIQPCLSRNSRKSRYH